MMEFNGTYFDGESSTAHPVTISADEGYVYLQGAGDLEEIKFLLRDCKVTPPLGNTPRAIRFPNGAKCETGNLDAIKLLDKQKGVNLGMHLVEYLEARWKMTLICLACLVVSIFLSIKYGIPIMAEKTAMTVPIELAEKISSNTMAVLDERFLAPSELDPEKTAEIGRLFVELKEEKISEVEYRLEFRKGSGMGPNAFALPSGLIVITDELINLADHEHELAAVFVHEIAHVEKRHGLRYMLQNAGVFLLISALVGDVTSITSAASTLPLGLVISGYSKNFEREADQAAGLYLIEKGVGTKPFQDILMKLSKGREGRSVSMFSSHPETEERIKLLEELELSFQRP